MGRYNDWDYVDDDDKENPPEYWEDLYAKASFDDEQENSEKEYSILRVALEWDETIENAIEKKKCLKSKDRKQYLHKGNKVWLVSTNSKQYIFTEELLCISAIYYSIQRIDYTYTEEIHDHIVVLCEIVKEIQVEDYETSYGLQKKQEALHLKPDWSTFADGLNLYWYGEFGWKLNKYKDYKTFIKEYSSKNEYEGVWKHTKLIISNICISDKLYVDSDYDTVKTVLFDGQIVIDILFNTSISYREIPNEQYGQPVFESADISEQKIEVKEEESKFINIVIIKGDYYAKSRVTPIKNKELLKILDGYKEQLIDSMVNWKIGSAGFPMNNGWYEADYKEMEKGFIIKEDLNISEKLYDNLPNRNINFHEIIGDKEKSVTWNSFVENSKYVTINGELLTFPDEMVYLGNNFKTDKDKVVNIKTSPSVIAIDNECFRNYSLLEYIVIPYNVTSIGRGAFSNCSRLGNVILPSKLKCIEDGAFAQCENLKNIKIPNEVTYIGNFAFMGCKQLQRIIIPESVKFIGESAFAGCKSLKEIILLGTIETIKPHAFEGCNKEYFPETIASQKAVFEEYDVEYYDGPSYGELEIDME